MAMSIEPARTAEQLRLARQIRYEVLVAECGYDVPGATPEEGLVDPLDDCSTVLLAMIDGEAVGTATVSRMAIMDGELLSRMAVPWKTGDAFGHKLAIRPGYRNGGVASRLLWAAVVEGATYGTGRGWLTCDPRLAAFYGRYGFRLAGSAFQFPGSTAMAVSLLYDCADPANEGRLIRSAA